MDPARPVPPGFPTAHEELLLRAAVDSGAAALAAWDEWSAGGRLETASFSERELLPAVYTNLVRNEATRPDMPKLRGIHRHHWTRQQLEEAAATRLAAALDTLPKMRLGAEVLVPHEQAGEAVELAVAAGWIADETSEASHVWTFRMPTGEVAALRRRALPYGRGDESDLWADGSPSVYELLVRCIDGLTAPGGPGWILQARELAREADWDRFVEIAGHHRLERPAGAALRCAARFGAVTPERVLERLQKAPDDALARALVGEPHGVRRGLVLHRAAYRSLAPHMSFPAFLLRRLELDHPRALPAAAARRVTARYKDRRRRSAALAMRA